MVYHGIRFAREILVARKLYFADLQKRAHLVYVHMVKRGSEMLNIPCSAQNGIQNRKKMFVNICTWKRRAKMKDTTSILVNLNNVLR